MAEYDPRKRSGNKFQKKPRPVLDKIHDLSPEAEAVIDQKSELYKTRSVGDELVRDLVAFKVPLGNQEAGEWDQTSRKISMPVYKAAMLANMQFGVPFDSPNFPEIRKFDTYHKSSDYYAAYTSPIPWAVDSKYVHIPCFTRYVMNKQGEVRNAFNEMRLLVNNWGSVSLVADGNFNKPFGVQHYMLKYLAFSKLPSAFIDFGGRRYSHYFDYDPQQGAIALLPNPTIVVKDSAESEVTACSSMEHFIKLRVGDYKKASELRKITVASLQQGSVAIDGYAVKLKDVMETDHRPVDDMPVDQNTPSSNSDTTDLDDFDI